MSGLEEEIIESALEATGFAWIRRESAWAIPATNSVVREISISQTADGLRTEAVLVEWDEAGARELEALEEFLHRATERLRFATCAVTEDRAVIAGEATSDELGECIGAVAAACRLLAREAAALLNPELAEMYLEVGCSSGGPEEASRGAVSRSALVGATTDERG